MRADVILANPPFNLKNWGRDELKDDERWEFGLPPAGNGNYAWVQHMLHGMFSTQSRVGAVLPNGMLSSKTGGEGYIREAIVNADLLEVIISMPGQLFWNVTIPVTVWVFAKTKWQPRRTLFIDAKDIGHMADRTHRELSPGDIDRLTDTYIDFKYGRLKDEPGYCKAATTAEIREQDYILTPGRYVGLKESSSEDEEPFEDKMKRLSSEFVELVGKSDELSKKILHNLTVMGFLGGDKE